MEKLLCNITDVLGAVCGQDRGICLGGGRSEGRERRKE